MSELRPYQIETLDRIRDAMREGARKIMVQMPTGAGKTRLAAEIVEGARRKNKRVAFTVPAISLIDQTVQMFYDEGIKKVGVMQANHIMTDASQPIQICSTATLAKRPVPDCDIVIRDEAHRLYKLDLYWMAQPEWAHVPFIGLSATPWTQGLGRHYERLIIGSTLHELIRRGWLVRFRVFAPSHPDLKGVRIQAGDYHEGDLAHVMNKNALTADIVNTWLEKASDRPTICFAVDRAHAKSLQERFVAAGVPAAYMDGTTPLLERERIRKAFVAKEIKVVCNVEVIGMGVDWPQISCISYCRPTRSEVRFVQNIGRGLRPYPGKHDLLILDHSDSSLRLGFVTDIHHDKLNMGRESTNIGKKVAPLPRECKRCGYLMSAFSRKCDNCGNELPPVMTRAVEGNGELAEFDGQKRREKKKSEWTMADKRAFYSELKAYAILKQFKNGWAYHRYHMKFSEDPPPAINNVAAAGYVSSATMLWIKHCNIALAKSKEAQTRINHAQEKFVAERVERDDPWASLGGGHAPA